MTENILEIHAIQMLGADKMRVTLCTIGEGHMDVSIDFDDPLIAPAWEMFEVALQQAALAKLERVIYPSMKIDTAVAEEPTPIRPCRICMVVTPGNVQVGASVYCPEHVPPVGHG